MMPQIGAPIGGNAADQNKMLHQAKPPDDDFPVFQQTARINSGTFVPPATRKAIEPTICTA